MKKHLWRQHDSSQITIKIRYCFGIFWPFVCPGLLQSDDRSAKRRGGNSILMGTPEATDFYRNYTRILLYRAGDSLPLLKNYSRNGSHRKYQ